MIITPEMTEKTQSIIDECSLRGEEVVFEKGFYKTATIFLRDNTHIVLKRVP